MKVIYAIGWTNWGTIAHVVPPTEHSVLLQQQMPSALVGFASSAGDVHKQLSLLDQQALYLQSLAADHQGQKLGKDMKQYLNNIKNMASAMYGQLRMEHDASQKVVSDALLAINACTAGADLVGVTQALQNAATDVSSHDACRIREVTTYNDAIGAQGACTAFKSALDTARACNAASEDGHVARHKSSLSTYNSVVSVQAQATACDTSLGNYEHENEQCQADQLNAERSTCQAHMMSHAVCGELDDCHARTRRHYQDTVCVDMVAPRDARKGQALAVQNIVCTVNKLLADDTDPDSLAQCDLSKDKDKVTAEFDIECAKPDDKPKCDWPMSYYESPGNPAWLDLNYRSQPWFGLSTNDLETRSEIEVKHECDLQKLGPVSRPLPSGATPAEGGGSAGETSYTTQNGWIISSDSKTFRNGDLYWLSNAIDGSTFTDDKTCSTRDSRYVGPTECHWLAEDRCSGSQYLSVKMEKPRCLSHVLLDIGYRSDSNITDFKVFADSVDVTPADITNMISEYNSATRWHIGSGRGDDRIRSRGAPLRIDIKASVQEVRVANIVSSGLCGFGEVSLFEGPGECW